MTTMMVVVLMMVMRMIRQKAKENFKDSLRCEENNHQKKDKLEMVRHLGQE